MAIQFPELPPTLRNLAPPDQQIRSWWLGWIDQYWKWWQALRSYLLAGFFTQGDVTIQTAAKGVVMTNAAGTVTKRARLNDAGNGWIFEDV